MERAHVPARRFCVSVEGFYLPPSLARNNPTELFSELSVSQFGFAQDRAFVFCERAQCPSVSPKRASRRNRADDSGWDFTALPKSQTGEIIFSAS